jgi:hypothetical protein
MSKQNPTFRALSPQRGRHNSHSTPSLGDVAIGVRGFFHAYIRRGECSGYEDWDEVTIEAQGRWYGIEICVRATPLLNMQVSAGADL